MFLFFCFWLSKVTHANKGSQTLGHLDLTYLSTFPFVCYGLHKEQSILGAGELINFKNGYEFFILKNFLYMLLSRNMLVMITEVSVMDYSQYLLWLFLVYSGRNWRLRKERMIKQMKRSWEWKWKKFLIVLPTPDGGGMAVDSFGKTWFMKHVMFNVRETIKPQL